MLAVERRQTVQAQGPEHLRTREAAQFIRRSVDHVLDLCRRGQLQPIRLSNGFLFRRSDLEQFLAKREDHA
jgi:excisionase family DNA binding protein